MITIEQIKHLPKERLVRFAKDCALINIELIKPYTDEYDLIFEFLKGDDIDVAGAYAVRAAADVVADNCTVRNVRVATWAVRAAVRTVSDNDWSAAWSATFGADCALESADADNKEKANELLKDLLCS